MSKPFKKKKPTAEAPATPVGLLPLLTRRTIPDAMSHQKEILESFAAGFVDTPDVALQLPTGSGKTLVGLLIAEWRRRKFKDRVVYLCPTRQLVNQTVAQARNLYGIDVVGFTGSHHNYSPHEISDYTTGAKAAITTYSALFNSSPFFGDPDVVLMDDAHAAENYISGMWSLEIPRVDKDLTNLHKAIGSVLQPEITPQSYARLTGDWSDPSDSNWVDKLPTAIVTKIADQLVAVLDTYIDASPDVRFTWPLLRDHLNACHVYISSQEILIRPLIPPTWSHAAFAEAKQRIYMSATLGGGGDLERLTGRVKIRRLEAPEEFKKVGVGRRFFVFPGLSLKVGKCEKLRRQMQDHAGRSVVLTPSNIAANEIAQQFDKSSEFKIFDATDIETSKAEFVSTEKAVAIMAGRFDGIDFPHDECRLLCLDGLPKATNAQERFIMTKMGAAALFNERMQTRVLQAAGRCTRAMQDRSVVFVTGDELVNYLADDRNWPHFHPELQAELEFGVFQSKDSSAEILMESFESFFANDENWEEANSDIVSDAKSKAQLPYNDLDELADVVKHEVKYQKALWFGEYEKALEEARIVLSHLTAPGLKGYRALWHYLAGAVSQMMSNEENDGAAKLATEQYNEAKKCAPTVAWLTGLNGLIDEESEEIGQSENLLLQVENFESVLLNIGTANDYKFEQQVKKIEKLLAEPSRFEEGQKMLGQLLGFSAGNSETDAAPDPWWLGANLGVVFEDNVEAKQNSVFGANKAKQAAGHPGWMHEFEPMADGLEIIPVIVTPCTVAGSGAKPTLKELRYWNLDEFRTWASDTIGIVRTLRSSLPPNGDLVWRMEAGKTLTAKGRTMETLINSLPVAFNAMEFQGT